MTKNHYRLIFIILALIYGFVIFFNNPVLELMFKPLPVLVLIVAILRNISTVYNKYLLGGMIFCMLGDILLLRTVNLFLPGLVSFLIAHILFILAFWKRSSDWEFTWLIPFLAYGSCLFVFLAPGLTKMFFPVLVYSLVIVIMTWRAFVQKNATKLSFFAFVGAILFCLSDSMLAIRLFHSDFALSRYLIMASYWTALYLIALTLDEPQKI